MRALAGLLGARDMSRSKEVVTPLSLTGQANLQDAACPCFKCRCMKKVVGVGEDPPLEDHTVTPPSD